MRSLLFVAIVSLFANIAYSQQIDAPAFTVNDTWTYSKFDSYRREKVDEWTQVVGNISQDDVTLVGVDRTGQPFQVRIDKHGNLLSTATRQMLPSQPMFRFPLFVGKQWEEKFSVNLIPEGETSNNSLKARVVAIEKVSVPAGEFEAWKIEYKGYFSKPGKGGTGSITTTYWFAPSIKRIVLQEYQDTTTWGSMNEKYSIKLEKFSVNDNKAQLASGAIVQKRCEHVDINCISATLRELTDTFQNTYLGTIMRR